jgi:hypothetical protein
MAKLSTKDKENRLRASNKSSQAKSISIENNKAISR